MEYHAKRAISSLSFSNLALLQGKLKSIFGNPKFETIFSIFFQETFNTDDINWDLLFNMKWLLIFYHCNH